MHNILTIRLLNLYRKIMLCPPQDTVKAVSFRQKYNKKDISFYYNCKNESLIIKERMSIFFYGIIIACNILIPQNLRPLSDAYILHPSYCT